MLPKEATGFAHPGWAGHLELLAARSDCFAVVSEESLDAAGLELTSARICDSGAVLAQRNRA